MSKPTSRSAFALVVGSSGGSRPGSTTRRRRQKWGWMSTGMPVGPRTRSSPSRPAVWSSQPGVLLDEQHPQGEDGGMEVDERHRAGELGDRVGGSKLGV